MMFLLMILMIGLGAALNILGAEAEKPAVAYAGAVIATVGIVWALIYVCQYVYREFKR